MSWWGYVWALAFGALSVAGLVDDYADGRSRAYLAWGVAAGLSAVVVFVAYFETGLARALGPFVVLLLGASAAFEATSAVKDIRHARLHDAEHVQYVWVGTAISLALYAPALVLGSAVAVRALRGAW